MGIAVEQPEKEKMSTTIKSVGDVVRWSDLMEAWNARSNHLPDIAHLRQRGIIYDENHKYFFVLWDNGERLAEAPENLEIVSHARTNK